MPSALRAEGKKGKEKGGRRVCQSGRDETHLGVAMGRQREGHRALSKRDASIDRQTDCLGKACVVARPTH